jgi:elongation factor 1-gamma
VLELPDGTTLFESNAIARFLARDSPVYSGSPEELAGVDNWMDLCLTELEPAVSSWVYTILGHQPVDKAVVAKASADTRALIQLMDNGLNKKDFLCGNQLTLADLTVFSALVLPYQLVFDDKFLKSFANFNRWFNSLVTREEVQDVWGKIHACRVPFPVPEPKQAPAPKAPAAKKAEPVKKQEEEKKAPAKKPANPLDLLAPTPLVLDDWKKLFSNTKDMRVTMDTFWNSIFDKDGWSIWKLDYEKVEGEGLVLYQTMNMLNGFLQRMDPFRKWSFGYLGVYGEEPDLYIKGAFMWRSLGIPQELIDHP